MKVFIAFITVIAVFGMSTALPVPNELEEFIGDSNDDHGQNLIDNFADAEEFFNVFDVISGALRDSNYRGDEEQLRATQEILDAVDVIDVATAPDGSETNRVVNPDINRIEDELFFYLGDNVDENM